MSDLEIVPVDPLDQRMIDEWLAVQQAGQDLDFPHLPRVVPASNVIELLRRSRYRRVERWVARRDGRVVAFAEIKFPLADNLHLAEVDLGVAPDRRRQGIGTALLQHVEQRAADQGRDTLIGYAVDTLAGGPARPEHGQRFAEAAGYVKGLDEVHRVADLTEVADTDLDPLLAAAWQRAEGYELVQWAGSKPAEILDGVAYLTSRMNLDAPIGDLVLEADAMDADRLREGERDADAAGLLALGTVARHQESGRIAGYTEITVLPGDERHCWQGDTIVDPGHRGHRIGTILKIENHRLLRSYRPRMRYVHTWNAEENAHMIGINEAVGYRAVDRWFAYQKRTGRPGSR